MLKVAIVMGSDSDLPVVRPAAETLEKLGIPFEVRVISAHRTPEIAAEFQMSYDTVKTRYRRGIQLLRERCCQKAERRGKDEEQKYT